MVIKYTETKKLNVLITKPVKKKTREYLLCDNCDARIRSHML